MSEHTPPPWAVSLQAEPRIPQYCQIWSRRTSQDYCVAGDLTPSDAAFIVLACNAWYDVAAIRARLAELENAK